MKLRMLLAVVVAGSAQATVIDNGQFGANFGTVGGATGRHAFAQSFIAPADARLVKFGMWLQGGAPQPPMVRIDLWGDDGEGNPDPENIIVKGTVVQSEVPVLTRFDTVTDVMLVPGERYHVVINGMDDILSLGSYMSTWDEGTNTIPGGAMHFTPDLALTWLTIPDGDFGVYVETEGDQTCYADFDGNGVLDLFDFLEFQNEFNAQTPRADCTGDGLYNLFDFLCYVNEFNEGCP